MINSTTYKPGLVNGVWQFPIDKRLMQQAERYGELREKEGRIYSDEEVAQLPALPPAHPYAREFQLRKKSLDRVAKCLKDHGADNILEIGCGNGWFLSSLVKMLDTRGTGVDIFLPELEQGARTFGDLSIDWIRGDIFKHLFPPASFDAIVIASAAQYFRNLGSLISRSKTLVKNGGCIHIVDTPFYGKRTLKKATERTYDYYDSLDMPWMTGQYYHHHLNALDGNRYEVIHNPKALANRVRRLLNVPVSPFPHFQIRKRKG